MRVLTNLPRVTTSTPVTPRFTPKLIWDPGVSHFLFWCNISDSQTVAFVRESTETGTERAVRTVKTAEWFKARRSLIKLVSIQSLFFIVLIFYQDFPN